MPLKAQPIIALDVPTLSAAQALVHRLGPQADYVKVGLELFTAEGPKVVEWLRGAGKRVFLDLKLHDIPNTVRGAARSAASMGASLLTVHGYGGAAMVDAAVEGAGKETGILVVTVLTSFDAASLGVALGREAPEMGGCDWRSWQTSQARTALCVRATRCGARGRATLGSSHWCRASG
jgi:orotidine-5'-phosphate decarboxylase